MRFVTPEIADILAKIKWQRFIRFSCDTTAQIAPLMRAAALIAERGIKAHRLFVYMIVTQDVASAYPLTEAIKTLKGVTIYAQPLRKIGVEITAEQKEFAHRYIYKGMFRTETWREYCERKGLFSTQFDKFCNCGQKFP